MSLLKALKAIFFGPRLAPSGELTCPRCGGSEWYEGPSGGMSTNIMCTNPQCEHWYCYHEGIFPTEDLHQKGRDRQHED